MSLTKTEKIAVLGLGYVGLPLALGLARAGFDVVGFDTNTTLVARLLEGRDPNGEVSSEALAKSTALFSHDTSDLAGCTAFILGVPTPITDAKEPDLGPVLGACNTIAPYLTSGALVVLESTVYPGVTEEVCGPALAEASGLEVGKDIKLGYSPERVNPGDAEHSLEHVVKVVAAQDAETLDRVDAIYRPVIKAGLHRASSIKTAEAAKVIENTQRDLNIALVNEFSLIFSRMGLDTLEVLEAAGTKWNFLKFTPGLVGGHCIGVDPYYLTFKAEEVGYKPDLILAARQINNGMGKYVAEKTIKEMIKAGCIIKDANVLILGVTFKEDCPDMRNTKVIDIIEEMKEYGTNIDVYDPWIDQEEEHKYYHHGFINNPFEGETKYDAIIVAVGHKQFKLLEPTDYQKISQQTPIIIDVKGIVTNPTWRL